MDKLKIPLVSPLILASQSPRRKQLLEWAEVPFEIVIKSTKEDYPDTLAVNDVPVHIARQKALAVRHMVTPDRVVLAADTVVVFNNEIIGKPVDREDAVHILNRLQGNTHQVITGVVVLEGENEVAFADVTTVVFYPLTLKQINFYVDKYKPYDKAGAYAIQEWIGVIGIKEVSGDFYNVMGLPISKVVQLFDL